MIEHAELVRLWSRLKTGDAQAQQTLFEQCYPDIAGYVLKRSRSQSDAEDIVSKVFTRCFNEIGRLLKPTVFRSWLYQLAHRCTIDFYRKKKVPVASLGHKIIECLASRKTDPAKIALQKEWFEQFYKVLDKLRADDRDYMVSVLEGMSLKEMAIIRGKSEGAVKEGIHRARIRLARALAEEPYFGDDIAVANVVKKSADKEIK